MILIGNYLDTFSCDHLKMLNLQKPNTPMNSLKWGLSKKNHYTICDQPLRKYLST